MFIAVVKDFVRSEERNVLFSTMFRSTSEESVGRWSITSSRWDEDSPKYPKFVTRH